MPEPFEPRIVAFFCNWCTYAAADLAGVSRMKYAPTTRVIRTMCSGRVDPQFVLAAFAKGADAVLLGGCHPGDCHYVEGNYKCLRRYHLLKTMLSEFGIEPERLRLEWISASEGDKVRNVVNEMTEQVRKLGPLRLPERAKEWDAEVILEPFEPAAPPTPAPGEKPKVAFYWCASCGGCEESLVDMGEAILEVSQLIDIVMWPVAMDFKRKDIEAMRDGEILVTMINGAVRTSEQEEMAALLRRKSQLIIAYGSCAYTGGIPALSNLVSRDEILRYVYHDAPTVCNPEGTEPQVRTGFNGSTVTLPEFRNVVRTLDQVVDVDYYMPGCAPNPELVVAAIKLLLAGDAPPKGSVLAPDLALCSGCPRIDSKPEQLQIAEYRRTHLHPVDPETCFLAQGFACLGPATRSGCGERCIRGNMPCTGCFGPLPSVWDQGAKMLSALASNIAGTTCESVEAELRGIPDPAGTFYRYGMAKSPLRRRLDPETAERS